MKYGFFSDPSHGWLKVSIEELKQLDLCSQISGFSYISADRKHAYLEEDLDAQIFLSAILEADWFEDMNAVRACTKNFYSDPPSFIRNLDSFADYQLSRQPVVQPEQIFNF